MSAATGVLSDGGSAADATVAAQAVLCVVMPEACGIGGDGLFLISRGSDVSAINGVGAAGQAPPRQDRPGSTVTVPGIVSAWETMLECWGVVGLARALNPAIELARAGCHADRALQTAAKDQRTRLRDGGAAGWPANAIEGERFTQPTLADLLSQIASKGAAAFYEGAFADAIAEAVVRHGGNISPATLSGHSTDVASPVSVDWNGGTAVLQPSPSQGVLLGAALQWAESHGMPQDGAGRAHTAIELTKAVFAYRAESCSPETVLSGEIVVSPDRASRRGGPRAYLHTAGVAVADDQGTVVSSLCSVFDDFGSAVFVPEGGFTLNNRADGFTVPPNDYAPGKQPVHTLAPAMVLDGDDRLALATPGADGQVQTLLQILTNMRWAGMGLGDALAAPRWRSEGSRLLVERAYAHIQALQKRGHDVVKIDDGDQRLGAAVAAGLRNGWPYAAGDWRRQISTGAV